MKKFEVGKVYKELDGDTMIRITKRTDDKVWFEFARYDGSSMPSIHMGFRYKKVQFHYNLTGEYIFLDIGMLGEEFSVFHEVDYEKVCKDYQDKRNALKQQREQEYNARIDSQANDLNNWLKSHNLDLAEVKEVLDRFTNINEDVFNRVAELQR